MTTTEDQQWREASEKVIPNIVTIKGSSNAFDSDFARTWEGTGFVVNAEKGYLQRS
jgi:hypothetical protein